MLVKLTVYGYTWQEAVDRLARALKGFVIIGVSTTIPYFQQILQEPDFIQMNFDTSYIDTHPDLVNYVEEEREIEKLSRLIAEINAYGYNPHAY
jgi:pyruvate carboxylase subunit A